MQPAQTLRLAAVTLLLTAGFPLLPIPDFLLPAVAQTVQDRKAEANRLLKQGIQQIESREPENALKPLEQALQIYRAIKDRQGQGDALANLGYAYLSFQNYAKAIQYSQQSLAIARAIKDQKLEVAVLKRLGLAYSLTGNHPKAISAAEQTLAIYRKTNDRTEEIRSLGDLGFIYLRAGNSAKAIEVQERGVQLAEKLKDNGLIFEARGNLEQTYIVLRGDGLREQMRQDPIATALEVEQTTTPRRAEADRLLQQGTQHLQNSQYRDAEQSLEKSIKLYRQIRDRVGEAQSLINLSKAILEQGNGTQARKLIQQAVAIAKELKNSKIENSAWQVLESAEKIANAKQGKEEAERLDTQALEQLFKGELEAAYKSSQQALTIYRALKDRREELGVLFRFATTLAVVSTNSSSARVRQYYEQALVIARELEDRETEKSIVDNLSLTQGNLEDYCRREIENNEQKLATDRKIQDQNSEIWTFGFLGGCYYSLQNYAKASMYYEKMITLARKLQNSSDKNDVLIGLSEEGSALDGLGEIYAAQGDYAKAIEYHQKHLKVLDKSSFASSDSIERLNPFSNIGYALQQQNQPELAIIFYKQAVNILESNRQSSREHMRQWEQSEFKPSDFDRAFSRWGQEAIASANSSIYRRLADLLLQQNRIIEAMQVLDLLKVEDLQDFLKDIKGNERTAKGVELLLQELSILERVNQSSKPSLNDLLKSSTIQSQVQTLQQTAAAQNLTLPAYKDLQARIQKLGKNIALFYPLILDDRLELVLFIPDRPPIRKTVNVKRTEFEREIGSFRKLLPDPTELFKIRQSAQQLYTWLVQPIDAELKAAKVQTIVYAPDGQMRYVPLAALHDGTQWLTERYQINYLTALALTPIDAPDTRSPTALTGALTQERTITVAGATYSFSPLDYTKAEVNQIAKTIPNTKSLIDQPFNRKNLLAQMQQSNIVHLATHAKFGGTPEESFIVLGDGDVVTLREIEAWKLPNVSLFVLSACETGLGGKLGNGLEILGFGYQMQRTGSRAAIASLWAVRDDSTSVLMSEFYAALQKGSSKAEALRQAQIELINSNYRHPLYWAPFILIGNGL